MLVLGGTGEARQLAGDLAGEPGMLVTVALAGRVAEPLRPAAAELRVGGFDGAQGLASWLREQRIAALVDATHPFRGPDQRQRGAGRGGGRGAAAGAAPTRLDPGRR